VASPREDALDALQAALGYRFEDRDLLDRALTHASVSGQRRDAAHNERLEFLGDRVLGLLTAEALTARFPEEREGPLSNRYHSIVDRAACARAARRASLQDCLRHNAINPRKVSPQSDTALADAAEALLAAIYLDGGLDAARVLFEALWAEEIDASQPVNANPKVTLQEWLLSQGRPAPSYEIVERTGPDHAPVFVVEARGDFATVRGRGRSRQDAEKDAARAAIDQEGIQ